MSAIARAVGRELLSLVVPPVCASCREPELSGAALCPDCRAGLVALPSRRCTRCGAPLVRAADGCRECRGRALAFASAWSPFAYAGVGRRVVAALKSRGAVAVAAFMGRELALRAPADLVRGTVVPVPARAGRRRAQGFNQAKEIARSLGRSADLPVRDVLVRTGPAPQQVGLERPARLANLRRSVRLRAGSSPPERALLVDDVYTTGATLDACARALRDSGTREVVGLTFARAVRG